MKFSTGRQLSSVHLLSLLVVMPWFIVAQQSNPKNAQPKASMGVSTGAAHAPVKDSHSRPITAGGFVDGAPMVFEDIARQSGLEKFHHRSGSAEKTTIIESPGSGVALLDYDNDGWLDIYLLNGSTFAALKGQEPAPRAMLLHNNHDGTFTDVTEKAGVANQRWGFGVAVADYDNDGWADIYVANYGKNRLYHNNHDGTFTDVAEKAGVSLGGWSTGPTWGDYDHDGLLDLFVPGYVKFDVDHPPIGGTGSILAGACQFRGLNVFCGPRGLPGEGDHLFHNNGDGTFTEVSVKAGVSDPYGYYGLASLFLDVDDDGWLDLVVANDSTPNYLYRNRDNGTFEDVSYMSGFALSGEGREQASMGIGIGDYNRDGKVDLYISSFSDDYNTLYRNEGHDGFSDVTLATGLAAPTIPFLGWGTGLLDYDNDGLLDIFVANGHVYPKVDQQDWGTTYAQRPQLFRNLDGSRFQEVPPATGSGLADVISARGAAFGDLFNDGHIDVVINNIDSTPTLLRNVAKNQNHWITLRLIGGLKSPRDAIGAKVFVTAGGARQRADVVSGGSYGSSSDQRVHFGLGSSAKIDKIEIHWPDGNEQEITVSGVDRIVIVREEDGKDSATKLDEAKSLMQRGMVFQAEDAINQYLEQHNDSADGHYLKGFILFREIQVAASEKAAKLQDYYRPPGGPDADFKRAKARASLAEYTEGAKYHVPSAFDLKMVALDYVLLGDYADADKWLSHSLEQSPDDLQSWYYLGRVKYNENRFEEAISAFKKYLSVNPKDVRAEDNLGLSYEGLDRISDAIAAYRNAIAWQAQVPNKDPGPFIDLGNVLVDQNRTEEAVPYLLQATEISPQDAKAHEKLGKAYSHLNRLPEAQAEFEKGIKISPESASLHYMLGQVYQREGLKEKAKLEFDRCAAITGTRSSPDTPLQIH